MTSKFEVVISGISGRFPKCDDVYTLQEKLCNLENFVSEKNGKWAVDYEYKYNGKFINYNEILFLVKIT